MADARRDILLAYRESFVRGMGALLPVILTIAALAFAWSMIDGTVGGVVQAALARATGHADIPRWAGTLAAIPALGLLCLLVGGTVGGAFVAAAEEAILRVPFASGVYRAAKEVVATLSGPRNVTPKLRRGVVTAPFGTSGARFVGLLPGTILPAVPKSGAPPAMPVFLSHVPTTVTGFLVFTREEMIHVLEGWKIEDFARFYASGGLAMPAATAATEEQRPAG